MNQWQTGREKQWWSQETSSFSSQGHRSLEIIWAEGRRTETVSSEQQEETQSRLEGRSCCEATVNRLIKHNKYDSFVSLNSFKLKESDSTASDLWTITASSEVNAPQHSFNSETDAEEKREAGEISKEQIHSQCVWENRVSVARCYPLTHESADWRINHTFLVELKTF